MPRPPTTRPDLRQVTTSSLLYLPPLLSLLPEQTPPQSPQPFFSFDAPAVGYTSSRLPSVDPASVALHYAMHKFRPTTEAYAEEPYAEAFNWDELELPAEVEREWYIVAFRSTRAKDSPSKDLYEADRLAHEEAVSRGGLLLYWYGSPTALGSNLATCIWQSRKHAVLANSGPRHLEAIRLAREMYEIYSLERYVLRKVKGETGVSVVPWESGEVAF